MWGKYYYYRDLLFKCQRSYRGSFTTDEYFLFIWDSENSTDIQRTGMLSYYVTMSIHFKDVDVERKEELYSLLLDRLDDALKKGEMTRELYTYFFDRVLDLISIDRGKEYGSRFYYGDPKSGFLEEMLEEIEILYNKRRLSIYVYEFCSEVIKRRLRSDNIHTWYKKD
uniref:Uncharacterized protein n=1 Tax=Pithovirus LCPAC401 TaxID=2506595 RepID=A0A481Z9L9_9VIRU|nr:MAG: uncharacterized protein LCPAC401_02510 [Pithovirus LCPAC401]